MADNAAPADTGPDNVLFLMTDQHSVSTLGCYGNPMVATPALDRLAATGTRFAGAFTFQYSQRPGTPAASMDGQVPADVVRERYGRLVELVEEITWAENQRLTGREVEVLVAEGEGRKDEATHRMSGRARDNRLVHFTPGHETPRPGDLLTTTITRAAPHHLIADAVPGPVRRTRGGDAWQARQEAAAAGLAGTGDAASPVLLGMPARRQPAG